MLHQNVSAAVQSNVTVSLPAGGTPADSDVAGVLARAWLTAAAASAGAAGNITVSPTGIPSASGAQTWITTGVTVSGATISLVATTQLSTDASSVSIYMSGRVSRTVTSSEAVSVAAFTAGAAAAEAEALRIASLPGSASRLSVAAAVAEIGAMAENAAAAIASALRGGELRAALTTATADALDSRGATAQAAAVRAYGVSITGAVTSALAEESPVSVGAIAAPATSDLRKDSFFAGTDYFASTAVATALAIMCVGAIYRHSQARTTPLAASTAGKALKRKTGSGTAWMENPLSGAPPPRALSPRRARTITSSI
jgi:hypothetical protein